MKRVTIGVVINNEIINRLLKELVKIALIYSMVIH